MKEIYAWVPWFRELAEKIAAGGRDDLIEQAKTVDWHRDDPSLLRYGDENIDPFSFLYFLAQKNTTNQREPVYASVGKVFDIDSRELLSDISQEEGFIIPKPNSRALVLFHDDKNGNPELLWKLFKQATQGSDAINADDFASVLKIKNVGVAKLTQTLFLINPNDFMPIDRVILKFNDAIDLPSFGKAKKQIEDKDKGWENYQSMLEKFKFVFPKCDFYEINAVLFRMMQWKNDNNVRLCHNVFQVSTNVFNDSSNYWKDFSKNNHVFTGGPGVGGWDAHKQNQPPTQGQKYYPLEKPQVGDIIFVRYGNNTGCAVGIVFHNDYANGLSEQREVNEKMRIHVLWLNKNGIDTLGLSGQIPGFYYARNYGVYDHFKNHESYKDTCAFIDKVRDTEHDTIRTENSTSYTDSINDANAIKHPLNQILYGPPGTGKTWDAVNHALAIIEGKEVKDLEQKCRTNDGEGRKEVNRRFNDLKESGQIEMVTFHQSFAYEDFIECIKPVLGDASGDLDYEIVDGVFKEISKRANRNLTQSSQKTEAFDLDVLLRDFAQHINDKIDLDETIKLWPETKYLTQLVGARILNNGKIQFRLALGESKTDYRVSTNIILRDYTKFINNEIKSYRDIKPTHKSKSGYHGDAIYLITLMEKIKTYQDNEWQTVKQTTEEKQNYVLIIDEINRGNIAKIFGELITLIEDTKRIGNKDTMTVTLPYSSNSDNEDGSFGVPNNLYIIGTMNTADRSIALLDTALRRRFDFIEMMPKPDHPLISNDIDGVNCRQLLTMMNKRITALLDREHQIGHSYFIDVDSMENLSRVFQHRIVPLLQEYFYDDWAKIDLVLNKNGFVTSDKVETDLFSSTDLVDAERLIYELIDANSGKWKDPANYKKIYATTQTKSDDGDGE